MLFTFNGLYKDDNIIVDAILIDPTDYDLDDRNIWFIVSLSSKNEAGLNKSDFIFYLLDKNKHILNTISVLEERDCIKKISSDITVFVGFEVKANFFYDAPVFCFYYSAYNKIEFINLID